MIRKDEGHVVGAGPRIHSHRKAQRLGEHFSTPAEAGMFVPQRRLLSRCTGAVATLRARKLLGGSTFSVGV